MIHYFNPGHETAVFNASPYYLPSETVLKMQDDLSFLPAWYAEKGDAVLLPEIKDPGYFKFLENSFPGLPYPSLADNLSERSRDKVSCWGISPRAIHYFETLNEKFGLQLQVPLWKEEYTYLNSRKFARDVLAALQKTINGIPDRLIPFFCDDIDEIEKLLTSSDAPLLAKSLYSSSGRGLLWLSGKLKAKEREVLRGMLRKQKEVAIEYVLDKQLDFSMQFSSDGKEISFEGYSLFETTPKGAYTSTYLYSQGKIVETLTGKIPLEALENIKQQLILIFTDVSVCHYEGCIGVDMMIYQDEGEYRIHPCLEINLRYNMGYLGVKMFQHYISPLSVGVFKINYNPEKKGAYDYHLQMCRQFPLSIEKGKIKRGYFPLNPVTKETRYNAFVSVEECG